MKKNVLVFSENKLIKKSKIIISYMRRRPKRIEERKDKYLIKKYYYQFLSKSDINHFSYKQKYIKKATNIKFKKRKDIIKIYFNIFYVLLFIISYYFYYQSLEKCLDGEALCSQKWDWIKLKITQLIKSAIILIIFLILIIYKLLSKLHLIHFVLTFISFCYYSHSFYFEDHGGYNLIALFLVLFLVLILLLIIKIFFSIFKIKYKYKILSFISLLFLYNIIINPTNCNDWPKGLNNTYIENDENKYGCKIRFPKYCNYKIMGFTQDLTRISHKSCLNKKKNSKKLILRYSRSPFVNKNTKIFGFPLTNIEEGGKDGREESVLKDYSFSHLMDMEKNIPPELAYPEYIVDFSNDPLGELNISLNFNETLSKERKKLENNSIPYSNNVLIIYIDSVSRANSIRKLKKTLNFFEQFMPYKGGHNKKYPEENFHSFQFLKYHSFKGLTNQNLPKIFYGNVNNAEDFVRINKYYKLNGYVTGYTMDCCNKDNTRTRQNLTKIEIYDHQLLICDPNKESNDLPKMRCLYGKHNSYYLFNYIEQFWRKYKNNRKFAVMVLNDAHEGTLEVVKYTDNVMYNFLISLYNDNLFKSSSILLVSDHGVATPSIYYIVDFFQIEIKLPMLYMIINDRKNIDYNQQYFNIHENQQTFITAYDIYNTISNIAYGDNYSNIPNKTNTKDTPKSPNGKSLFEKINQKERRPKIFSNMDKNV